MRALLPDSTAYDVGYGGRNDPIIRGHNSLEFATITPGANLGGLLAGQPRVMVRFAANPVLPFKNVDGVMYLLCLRSKFKVTRPIMKTVAVLVVDGETIRDRPVEMTPHETVGLGRSAVAITRNAHGKIATILTTLCASPPINFEHFTRSRTTTLVVKQSPDFAIGIDRHLAAKNGAVNNLVVNSKKNAHGERAC